METLYVIMIIDISETYHVTTLRCVACFSGAGREIQTRTMSHAKCLDPSPMVILNTVTSARSINLTRFTFLDPGSLFSQNKSYWIHEGPSKSVQVSSCGLWTS